jgi:WD40 repeat protein
MQPHSSLALAIVATCAAFLGSGRFQLRAQDRGDAPLGAGKVVWRLGSPNLTHPGSVDQLQIFPDGTILVSLGSLAVGRGGAICLWESKGGKLIASYAKTGLDSITPTMHKGGLAAVEDGALIFFEKADLNTRRVIVPSGCRETRLSPTGKLLGVLRDDKIELRDTKNFKILSEIPLPSLENNPGHLFRFLAFSQDGNKLAVAAGAQVVVWQLGGLKKFQKVGLFASAVASFAFSPDSQRLAVTTVEGELSLWSVKDAPRRLCHNSIKFSHCDESYRLPVLFIGRTLLVTGDCDGILRFWDDSLKSCGQIKAHLGYAGALALTPDRKFLYSAGPDQLIKCWDVLRKVEKKVPDRLPGAVAALAANPKSSSVALGTDNRVGLWDFRTATKRREFATFDFMVLHLMFSGDGHYMAASTGYQPECYAVPYCTLKVWDLQKKQEILAYINPEPRSRGSIPFFILYRDRLFFAEIGSQSFLRAWDLPHRKLLYAVELACTRFAISPDGSWIAAIGPVGQIYLLAASNGKVIDEVDTEQALCGIGFDAKNRIISCSKEGCLGFWENQQGVLRKASESKLHWSVSACALSDQGNALAVGTEQGRIHLIDLISGKVIGVLAGHSAPVKDVQFVGNDYVFSCGWENTCVLWNISGLKKGNGK